jgi:hypothetical protein
MHSGQVRGAHMRGRGVGGISANENSCAQGAHINLGDLTPYLTYDR